MKVVNLVCRAAFELSLILFVTLAVLAPLEARFTRHFDLVQTIDSTHGVLAGDFSGLSVGDDVPLYRLNSGWKTPIAHATITGIAGNRAHIVVNPATLAYPLGRSGTFFYDESGTVRISLGSNQEVNEGMLLSLFRDRRLVGEGAVLKVDAASATVQLPQGIGDIKDMIASEYTFATQGTAAASTFVHTVELAVIVGAIALYTYTWWRSRRSPLFVLGDALRKIPLKRSYAFWFVHLIAGIPFAWFMSAMPLYLINYVVSSLALHIFGTYVTLYFTLIALLPFAAALIAFVYYGYLAYTRRSPILAFWRLISYHGEDNRAHGSLTRGLLLWALHLVIVYAFASTLWGFLIGNLAAANTIGFPAQTFEGNFEYIKFLIWAFTIVGVLVGYGYSVISILWGKYIRNLDFTIVGWLTNGFCYPLFGVVIWQITPGFTGPDPIIVGGPLLYLMLILGLVLNILYMLSIFNLGILFDLMTDKGVRTSGFYSVIRHPNYMLEACMFFTMEMVALSNPINWLGLAMFFFLYGIRSEREDNFMQYSNPDYRAYQKTTPYKFIPGMY